ncbi:MAG: MATE family efflux transporter [Tannerella sp.]|jgi:putative MATE family efflux protein|nr:MATE family efflux transporter [Tannerella sp.]
MSAERIQRGDLTHGTVWKAILIFAFPLLIGNILQQTYNLVDSIIVGQFLGKEALAAVSASFFIYYFIIALVIGIGSGITVVVSQYYGARRYEQVQRAFSSSLIFMTITGILLSVVGIVLAEPFFRLTHTPADVLPQAVRYFRIYMGGTCLFIIFNSIISILRGIGDSKLPMLFILVTVVLNVLLSLLFIIVFQWGIEGVAFATILAQGAGMCIALAYMRKRHPILSIRKKDFVFDRKIFLQGLKIGFPTSIQQCSIAVGLIALLSLVNSFGTDMLTAYGAAGKVDTLVTQAILTLSSALSAFCGQNIGAGHYDRVRKGLYSSMAINLFFCFIFLSVFYFFGKDIMQVFTGDENVIAIGYEYLLIIGSFLLIHGTLNILNGALRGAGDTLFTMVTSLITFWLARIPLAYYLSGLWGRTGIWWAVNISITVGLIATAIYYKTGKWKTKSIIRN